MVIDRKRLQQGGLTLVYEPNDRYTLGGKHFYFRFGDDTPGNVTVTGRDLSNGEIGNGYNSSITQLLNGFNPKLKILEIGAGLGELPQVVDSLGGSMEIVDFVDYSTCLDLFDRMYSFISDADHIKELMELRRRADLVLTRSQIVHHKKSLESALKDSSLKGRFDVVVDNFGPQHWDWSVKFQDQAIHPRTAEKYFLREGGIIIGEPRGGRFR
jgi:hypothetical protein